MIVLIDEDAPEDLEGVVVLDSLGEAIFWFIEWGVDVVDHPDKIPESLILHELHISGSLCEWETEHIVKFLCLLLPDKTQRLINNIIFIGRENPHEIMSCLDQYLRKLRFTNIVVTNA